jgi:hypothetical protein
MVLKLNRLQQRNGKKEKRGYKRLKASRLLRGVHRGLKPGIVMSVIIV